MEEKIRQELYEKLEQELTSYKQELSTLTTKEIIDKSYETTVKEEVIYLFYPESKQFEIDEKNSLETLYQGWMDSDLNINQILEDNVRDTMSDLVDEYREKQSKKKDKER